MSAILKHVEVSSEINMVKLGSISLKKLFEVED